MDAPAPAGHNEETTVSSHPENTGSDRAADPRSRWVDAAKAISILLIVTWHTINQQWPVNAWLGVVRVPLFFFTAGFFAAKSLHWKWKIFLRDRIGHLMYLYIIWVGIYFCVRSVEAILVNKPLPTHALRHMFDTPLETLWFIYVLAITFVMARVTRHIPILILVIIVLLLYCWSLASGDWRNMPLPDRIVRAAPFFLAGTFAFRRLDSRIRTYDKWWPLLLLLYIPVQLLTKKYLANVGPVMLIVPATGIIMLLLLASWSQRTVLSGPLNYIGARTIQIFLLHRLILYLSNPVLDILAVPSPYANFINWVVAVVGSVAIGGVIERHAPWLFESPWRRTRQDRRGQATLVVG